MLVIFALARSHRTSQRAGRRRRLHRRGVLVHELQPASPIPRSRSAACSPTRSRGSRPRPLPASSSRRRRAGCCAVGAIRALYPARHRWRGRDRRAPAGVMSTVLFVCRQNAGRSQMSRRCSNGRRGGSPRAVRRHDPRRARPSRGGRGHAGIRNRPHRPRRRSSSPTSSRGQADVVVTMGCGDECPFIPGMRYIDGTSPTRTASRSSEVRAIRDEIADRVRRLRWIGRGRDHRPRPGRGATCTPPPSTASLTSPRSVGWSPRSAPRS